ncbi:MAG: hypothetical protein L0220_24965 [Acidobacteria bacterium]|nr:hypothetical protein [Acidobacteriota bacterium]
MTRWGFITLCLCLAGCTLAAGEGQPIISQDAVCPGILVEAKVIAVAEQQGVINATLQVSDVYKGEVNTEGHTFSVSANKSGQGSYGLSFYPPLKQGQVGIWLMKSDTDKVAPDLAMGRLRYVKLPSRQGVDARYTQTKNWAESVEAVSKASPESRLTLMKNYALSKTPEVSAWAIQAISQAKPPVAEALYRDLLNSNLSVGGRIAIDGVLLNIKGTSWITSEERLKLLHDLVGGKTPEYEAGLIHNMLSAIVQRGETEDRVLLNLLKKFINNKDIPITIRQNSAGLVGMISKRSRDDAAAFNYLIEIIKMPNEDEIKTSAAYAMRNFVPLDKERLAVIQNLKTQISDKKLAAVLEEALNQARTK